MVQLRTLLIIDDCPEDREFFRRCLRRDPDWQYTILEEESAKAGLAACQRTPPDAILLDLLLPDLTGLEFVERLRSQTGDHYSPVIMITGSGDESIAVQALKQGIQDYLVKDKATPEKLQAAVRSAIKTAELRRSLKQSQDELNASQQLVQTIMNTTPGLIYLYDVIDQRNIFINSQVSDLIGYTAEQVMAMGSDFLPSLIHPDDLDRLIVHWDNLNHTTEGEVLEIEYRMRHANGEWHWFHSRDKVFVRLPDGSPQQILGIAQDITRQKHLERERHGLLTREQAARRAAEIANRTKDEFLAIVSHELRSPLNAILGWAKLLRTRALDTQTRTRALETIERSAHTQSQLIDDLLDIARIMRGKLRLQTAPVNLATVIESALNIIGPSAHDKQIRLTRTLISDGQPAPYVLGDANRLQQILLNLLSNAVKFTPIGGRVEVTLKVKDEGGRMKDEGLNSAYPAGTAEPYTPHFSSLDSHPSSFIPHPSSLDSHLSSFAEITVSDTGKGISLSFLPHIFERFRQADLIANQPADGLGLGLAIVRELVELHGGTIRADSPGEGQGATFTVQLPLWRSQPHASLTTAASQDRRFRQEMDEPLPLQGARVLIVDDDPDSCVITALMLEQQGGVAMAIASGEQILAALDQFQPDLLISDIAMPDEDGYALVQRIRALPAEQGGQIPAIALTAYAEDNDCQQAMLAGFQAYLAKPVNPDELIRVIRNLLKLDNPVGCRST